MNQAIDKLQKAASGVDEVADALTRPNLEVNRQQIALQALAGFFNQGIELINNEKGGAIMSQHPISAEDINPITGSMPADTMNNISNILSFTQDLIAQNENMDFSILGSSGLFVIIDCMRLAIDYEVENRIKNLVRAWMMRIQAQFTPTTIDDAWQALGSITASDRDTWLKVLMALKSEFGDDAYSIADAWSQGADNYKAKDFQSVCKSLNGNGIKINTVFYLVKQSVWNSREPDT
jgi:hypothetical protein